MVRVQRLASAAVTAVLAGRNLNEILARTWAREATLSSSERGAIQDLSFGTLRHFGQLAAVRSRLVETVPSDERLDSLLLVALYQLIYSQAAAYAIVDSAVDAARTLGKRRGAGGFVNAVLRNFLRGRDALLAAAQETEVGRFSYPQWWIDKLRLVYPQQWEAILTAGNQHPPLTLRVNRRKSSVAGFQRTLTDAGIAHEVLSETAVRLLEPRPVEAIPGFSQGLVSVQDAAAQHAPRYLGIEDGLRVLDACAAPGGKTGHLLETAAIDLTAIDKDRARVTQIASNLKRLGLSARLVAADAADLGRWWNGAPFDRVLLDVPCSASGVVKRHPDIKWLRRASDIETFVESQRRLLEALWQVLRKGGKFLYVTCSVFPEENQEQITAFCERHADAVRRPLTDAGLGGGQSLPNDLSDGFFYALLGKRV